ncbi:MAG: biotin/lipoyl-binding protein [Acidobacteria bacterium]|nr:biotin/lipoyl-binding protein [Acidobacteriota bacterium]
MELIVSSAEREVAVEAQARENGDWTIAIDGREYRVDAATVGRPDVLSVIVDGRQTTASVRALGEGVYVVNGAELRVIDPRSRGLAAAAQQAEDGAFEATAYMPGRVTAVLAAEGEDVAAGQGVLVLEAMKMENEIQSEIDGRLEKLLVEVGQTVDGGDPLFVVSPTDGATAD